MQSTPTYPTLALERYTAWQHLRQTGAWPDAVPDWARNHIGRMDEAVAKNAVIEELANALAAHEAKPVPGSVSLPAAVSKRIDAAATALSVIMASNNLGNLSAMAERALQGLRGVQANTSTVDDKTDREPQAGIQWPAAKDVGRYGDMSPIAHLRVGLDSDGDAYVWVCDEGGSASVEFCAVGAGGGSSSRTRLALIALMVAMEADNKERPDKDWWARRGGCHPSA